MIQLVLYVSNIACTDIRFYMLRFCTFQTLYAPIYALRFYDMVLYVSKIVRTVLYVTGLDATILYISNIVCTVLYV